MKRNVLMILLSAAAGATVAGAGALIAGNEPPAAPPNPANKYVLVSPPLESQPDTKSSNWRFLSDDVGMLLRRDERLGLRARIYVRVNGLWSPVATDTLGDLAGAIPVK